MLCFSAHLLRVAVVPAAVPPSSVHSDCFGSWKSLCTKEDGTSLEDERNARVLVVVCMPLTLHVHISVRS